MKRRSRSSSSTESSVKNFLDPKDGLFQALEELEPDELLEVLMQAVALSDSKPKQPPDSGDKSSPTGLTRTSPEKKAAPQNTPAKLPSSASTRPTSPRRRR